MSLPRGRHVLLPLLGLFALVAIATLAAGVDIDEELVVSAQTNWDEAEYTVSADVSVVEGGHLNITGATLTFVSTETDAIGIQVLEGGRLTMRGVTCQASEHPYAILTKGGEAVIIDTALSGLYDERNESLYYNIVGGLMMNGSDVHLMNVSIESDGVGLTAIYTRLNVEGLAVNGGGRGMVMVESEVEAKGVQLTNVSEAILAVNSTLALEDAYTDDVFTTLSAYGSAVTISNLTSVAWGSHLSFERGNASVSHSEFLLGTEGVMTLLGCTEVEGCRFWHGQTAVEMLFCDGTINDVLVEGSSSNAIVLMAMGYYSDEPRFGMDNVTVRNGTAVAIRISDCNDLLMTNITIDDRGDGMVATSSTLTLVDALITDSFISGPSEDSTGVGIHLETAWVDLFNVTVEGCEGSAVNSYFSRINATDCAFTGSGGSGMVMVYSQLSLVDCEVSGNSLWGVEALAYEIDPAERYRPGDVTRGRRPTARERDGAERARDFEEFNYGLTEEQVLAEADRCLSCGQCARCNNCIDNFGCPAIYKKDGRVYIDEVLCVGCGVCAQLCPNDAIVPVEPGTGGNGQKRG